MLKKDNRQKGICFRFFAYAGRWKFFSSFAFREKKKPVFKFKNFVDGLRVRGKNTDHIFRRIRVRENNGRVFPLYFGYGLRIRLEKIQKALFWPFRKHWQQSLAAIILVSLVSSAFFVKFSEPQLGQAAAYSFVQTDWSGGADSNPAVHPGNQLDWNNFSTSSNIVLSAGQISLASSSTSFSDSFASTANKDAGSTTAEWTGSGQIGIPTDAEGVSLGRKLNGYLSGIIYSFVRDGDNIYIGASSGKFLKYNFSTEEVTDLSPKIASFWSTYNVRALGFDASERVIYLGTTNAVFARYNLPDYSGGGAYPTADTAYNLTAKVSSFFSAGQTITSIEIDSSNKVVYMNGGNWGHLVRYNTSSYAAGGTYPTADTAYGLSPGLGSIPSKLIFDASENVLYFSTSDGKFARYNTTSYTAGGDYPTANTFYVLTAKISSFWSTNSISSFSLDQTEKALYLGGANGKFARYNTASYAGGGTYPTADTAYDLTAKISSFWSTNLVYELAFDAIEKAVYLGGNGGKLARYNTASYAGGGTYPTADTAYDLTVKISSFWSTNYVFTMIFEPSRKILFLGGQNSRFARYNATGYNSGGEYPDSDSAYNLTSTVNGIGWGNVLINSIIYEPGSGEIYIGGSSGKFAKYDPVNDIFTDLTAKISSFWSSSDIYSMVAGGDNTVYLVGSINKLARYNTASYAGGGTYPTADTAYDLTAKISSLWSLSSLKSVQLAPGGVLYIGGASGRLARYNTASYAGGGTYPTADTAYNLTAKISSFWSTDWIQSVSYDSNINVLYLGGMNGKFARYNTTSYAGGGTYPTADTAYDLSAKISSFWSANTIDTLAMDAGNHVLYLGGVGGKFARYNTTSYAGGGTYPTADTAYDIGSKISSFWGTSEIMSIIFYSDGMYLSGVNGKLARYNTASYAGGGTYPTADTAYDLTARFSSFLGGLWVTSLTVNPVNGAVFAAGTSGNFGYKLVFIPIGTAIAQSVAIDDFSADIGHALFEKNDILSGTSTVNYYLSNNGGIDWEQVVPGNAFIFSTVGSDLRFKIELAGSSTVQDISITYWSYINGELVSSVYDSSGSSNIPVSLVWSENLAASTDVKFQLRTSADNISWTDWLGPTGATSSYFTAPDGSESMPVILAAGENDRYMQYKAFLESADGVNSPGLEAVTLGYELNSPPRAAITNGVSQSSDGSISVDFETRDPDSVSGSYPGLVVADLQYCTAASPDDCPDTGESSNWSNAASVGFQDAVGNPLGTSTLAVDETASTSYRAVWMARDDFPGNRYDGNYKVRIRINDRESGNNFAYAVSGNFSLDTEVPALGATPLYVDASVIPASLSFDATDDSSLELQASLDPDFSGASWEPYAATGSMLLVTDPDTVYVRFKDAYGNISTTSVISAERPATMIIRDISNIATSSIYQLFIAWKAVSTPIDEFRQHNIWRSDDGGTVYGLIATTSKAHNYYVDQAVSSSSVYYYKITSENADSVSFFSSVVSDVPDGQGGTDTTPPTISNVEIATTTTQSATIEWDTTELSDSTLVYSSSVGIFSTTFGISTMADMATSTGGIGRHRVTLSGLSPNTPYYFEVRSSDPYGNEGSANNGGDGFTFTTKPGPIITPPPTPIQIDNHTVTINWTTDINSNSIVVFSPNADMADASSTIQGMDDSVTDHSVTVTGLDQGTKYYYYIKSADSEGNEAIDNNVIDGVVRYYYFVTANDNTSPVISDIGIGAVSDTEAVVEWKTDERATAKVHYGTASSTYSYESDLIPDLNTRHAVNLSGLASSTIYHYIVVSSDPNGNVSTSSENVFSTLERLTPESQVILRELAAENSGYAEGQARAGGGGMLIIDKTDKIAPAIAGVRVENITADSAVISWETDENASSFVEHGPSIIYGRTLGVFGSSRVHAVRLDSLEPSTLYHVRAVSSDASGNISYSADQIFSTVSLADQLKQISTSTSEEDSSSLFQTAAGNIQKAMSILSELGSQVSVNLIQATFDSFDSFSSLIPPPLMSGEPRVDISASAVSISWTTDKEANSLIALAKEGEYEPARTEAYVQVVGLPNDKTKTHSVVILDLSPDTLYHYQLRSKAAVGPEARSRDFVFKTKPKEPEITTDTVEAITAYESVFKWSTNIDTDSTVRYTPYRNNVLAVDETRSKEDKTITTIHSVKVPDFEPGTTYQIELSGMTQAGIRVTKTIRTFSTSKDSIGPEVSDVQTDLAISQGRDSKVQTVISWNTDEPATGRVYYMRGFAATSTALAEMDKTSIDTNHTKRHAVVIAKFEPGTIYTFRIESSDSSGNTSISKLYTVLTPRQKESVFQVIMKNFESIFSWMGNMNQQ